LGSRKQTPPAAPAFCGCREKNIDAANMSSAVSPSSASGAKESPPKTLLASILVCLFYGTTSGSLALVMKSLLSGYQFQGFFLILAAQYGLQLALCVLSRDHMANPLGVPLYDRAVHMRGLRMGLLGVANVGAGLIALRMVNVPMFLCIRRLVSPFIVGYEFLVLARVPSAGVAASVGGILLGTLLAGWETLNADMVGYAITILNNVLSAAVRRQRPLPRSRQPANAPFTHACTRPTHSHTPSSTRSS